MNDPSSEPDLFNQLAFEFAERYRRGERPTVAEYAAKYPELAREIEELFPALVVMEEFGSVAGPPASPIGGGAVPKQLGEYHILREVAHGGMGVVYEAVQESLGRHVALKVLPAQAALRPAYLERFRREAQAAARLHHTNIVPVYGVGEADGVHYYAMQFIQGHSLDGVLHEVKRLRGGGALAATTLIEPRPVSDLLAASVAHGLVSGQFPGQDPAPAEASPPPSPLPLPAHFGSTTGEARSSASGILSGPEGQYFLSVARLGVQVVEALAYAHQQGVLHRDIKPSNLLLDTQGTVWVTDFGLAKAEGAEDLTSPGDVVGTLRYMPPERFAGQSDVRGDIYGLGLTLYELLTLRPAFEDLDRNRLVQQVLHEEPPRPRKIDPRLPRDLETIVLKAIAKEPERRYATAAELAGDLRRFLADRPIRARRASALEHAWRWCRRNPVVAGLIATVLLLMLAVAVISSTAALWLGSSLEAEAAARTEADTQLWVSLLERARAGRQSRQPGQRFASLRAIQEALKLPLPKGRSRDELRTEAIACLLLPDLEGAREWTGRPLGTEGYALDAAFERYAWGDKDGTVSVRRLVDDVELWRLPGVGQLHSYSGVQFSTDRRFLVQTSPDQGRFRVRLWRLEGAEPLLVLDAAAGGQVAFHPNCREVALATPDGMIQVHDPASGEVLRRFPSGLGQGVGAWLTWNPRRPVLAAWGSWSVRLLDANDGRLLREFSVPGRTSWVDWHPEGRLLAVSADDYQISLWNTETGLLARPLLAGHRNGGVFVRFNHAGDRLLSNDWSQVWRLWDVRTGRQLLAQPAVGTCLQFSPDDTLAAASMDFAPRPCRLFRFRSGSEFATLARHNDRAQPVEFHPLAQLDTTGRLLAVGASDGIALLDIQRGEVVGHLPLPGNYPLCFEPNNTALLTYGLNGLQRWPIQSHSADKAIHRIGPPEPVYPSRTREYWGSSADGQVVGIPNYSSGAFVYHRFDQRTVLLQPQQDVRFCAVSPDGRWVATGSHGLHESSGAKVWDAETGQLVKELPVGGFCRVGFSPDGRWLLTTSGGVRLWAVEIWQEGPRLSDTPGYFVFTTDGRLTALEDDLGVVRLVHTDTGRELARLTAPEQTRLLPLCFTPDGGRLVAFGGETGMVYVVDLRAIRRQLAELGLDWDQPPLPPQDSGETPRQPLTIEVDHGGAAPSLSPQVKSRQRIEQARVLFQERPEDTLVCNELAWAYLTAPEPLRNVKEALALAEKAVKLRPENVIYQDTLALAFYRDGQYRRAVEILEPLLKSQEDRFLATDLYVLAMSHHKLGHAGPARDFFVLAGRWSVKLNDLSPDMREELAAFRAEAVVVLGLEPPPAPKPDHP